jgi:hypothetical protein
MNGILSFVWRQGCTAGEEDAVSSSGVGVLPDRPVTPLSRISQLNTLQVKSNVLVNASYWEAVFASSTSSVIDTSSPTRG